MTATPGAARPRIGADGALVAIGLVAAVAIGALVGLSPILGIAAVGGLAVLWLISFGTRMVPVFHIALVLVLIGYAFLGKGMAYVGAAPLYVGELVLVLGAIAMLVSLPGARWRPVHGVLAAFMAWGLIQTIPYVGTYGILAFRDGVAYGYGLFAFAVSLTVHEGHIRPLLRLYHAMIPFFIAWVPIAAVLFVVFGDVLPLVPGSNVQVIVFKGGDMGVHLGAIGAFMLLGLGGGGTAGLRDGLIWAGWLVGLAVAGAINRGGMVAASMMALAILFGTRSVRWLSLVLVGMLLIAVFAIVDPQVDLGLARRISMDQVISNVLSVFRGTNDPVLEGTKEWRLRWWNEIVDYTVGGEYFWTGKGFGINLADSDGFQVNADGSLRAPHNGHLELLARGGVPALGLWILLQVTFGITMLRAAIRARRAGLAMWTAIVGWIVVYWLAAFVNASFDVYLQNPMGGIWFWSIMGLGIAVAGIIGRKADDAARVSAGGAASARSRG